MVKTYGKEIYFIFFCISFLISEIVLNFEQKTTFFIQYRKFDSYI